MEDKKVINYDARAAEYIEAVKKLNTEPNWDIVHTAYLAGCLDSNSLSVEYGDWQTRLKAEQNQLKTKLLKLVDFINSEKYYTLSDKDQTLLKSQKIAMELYLSILNARVYDNTNLTQVPDLGMLQTMSGILGVNYSKIN